MVRVFWDVAQVLRDGRNERTSETLKVRWIV